MIYATFKTTENSELVNLRLKWVRDNWELWEKTFSDWENTCWMVIQKSGFQSLQLPLKAPYIQRRPDVDDKTWWQHFPRKGLSRHLPVQVSTAQKDESKKKRGNIINRERPTLMTKVYDKFPHRKDPRASFLFNWKQQGQSKNVLYAAL
jgi:hypothetical protein